MARPAGSAASYAVLRVSLIAVAAATWITVWAAGDLVLTDIAAESGLHLVNISGTPDTNFIVDSIGNGAAFFDADADGDLDILIVNGSTLERLRTGGNPMAALYRNDGGGRFTDITTSSGLTRRGWGMGVCVADYDNDGDQDLYITAFGPNVAWRNNGDGTFSDATDQTGLGHEGWGTSCAFGDYNRDGHVDLYVANYVAFDPTTIPARGATPNCQFMATNVFCGPNRLPGDRDVLYRNRGEGTFEDVTTKAGAVDPGYYGLGVVFADLDDDGWPDIYVANDSVPNLLFRNRRDGTFVEIGLVSGTSLSGNGRAQAGMGVAAGDYNNDGSVDLVVTNFSHDHNTLYENGPPGAFTDASYGSGLAATAGPYLGWGVGLVDVNNDGRLDVFLANGHVYPDVDGRGLGTKYRQRNQLFLNTGRRLSHVTADVGGRGLTLEHSSRGAAFGDYDNDGDIDMLIVNMHEAPTLLRNDTPGTRHWATIRLEGTRSNRDGIGARVSIRAGERTQTVEAGGDGSYLSHSDSRVHVGLDSAARIDHIEIQWPSGQVDTATNLDANRFYVAREGRGLAPDDRLR